MEPLHTNDFNTTEELPVAAKKTFLLIYLSIGGILLAVISMVAVILWGKGGINPRELIGDGATCPQNQLILQACSYELLKKENPEIEIPSEFAGLTSGITCPATREELSACASGKPNPDEPSSVNLRIKVNEQGPFDSEQAIAAKDSLALVWDSTNANFCTIRNDNGLAAQGNVASEGTQPVNGAFKPGSRISFTIKCGDAEDTISVAVHHYKLTDFSKAENRWISRFDTSTIPTNAYKAFYFNSTNPAVTVKSEVVPKVQINYAWSDGPGFSIKSEDFGGYWIGKTEVREAGLYTLTLAQSWADVRVIINGYQVPSTEGELKIDMAPGSYQIEVEYLNNWHTTDFLMTFDKGQNIHSKENIQTLLNTTQNSYDLWYVSGYNEDPVLEIPTRAERPTILVLDSYEPNQWVVKNAKENNIAYILYSSFTPGATVTSNLDTAKVLLVNDDVIPNADGYGASGVKAQCWTDNYPPRCDNVYTITNLQQFAQNFLHGSLTGFTGLNDSDQNLESVTIPRISLNGQKIAEIEATNNKIKADAEIQAKKESGNSVETLFNN